VDVRTPAFEPVEGASRTVWQHEFKEFPGARSLRLRFAHVRVPKRDGMEAVELLIQDRSGSVVERFGGASLERLAGRWSLSVPGDYALVSLVAPETPVGVEIVIDAVTRTTTPGTLLSVIGPSELQQIADYAQDPFISGLARPVAKLAFVAGGISYVCSGFMISEDRLMTNEHCVADHATCLTTIAIFDYQLTPSGLPNPGVQYRCADVLAADHELDVAVLRLEQSPGLTWGMLHLTADMTAPAEALMIVQHPGGRPKMISLIECAVTQPVAPGRGPETDIAHRCDTEGGSSGSPIMRADGRVVGLHHFGVGQGAFWNENRGVRMERIMATVLAGIDN
jgi:V8-like Glu-specific endopeptidase